MSKRKLDYLGVSAFCESMAMMAQAGIQTDEAIALLQSGKEHTGGLLEEGLAVMKEQVDAGCGLAKAMESTGLFPDYALHMAAAGESSGRLEDILFRLASYYAEQKTISEKLKNAVTYPAAMLVLIIAVLSVMLVMVLPAFTDVYNNLTGSLSASTYSYVRWAYAFCWIALAAMILIAASLESMAKFRFTSALATFLASGEMQDEAVLSSIPMTDYAPVEKQLKSCALRMEEGKTIAQAAYDEGLFEPIYGRMLLAGERSGGLEHILGRLTELLENNCSNLVDRLIGIVDPLLSGVLMLTVGLSLLSAMLPLIGMMNAVA